MNERSGRLVVMSTAAVLGGLLLASVSAAAGSAPAPEEATAGSAPGWADVSTTLAGVRALAESTPVTVAATPTTAATTATTAAPTTTTPPPPPEPAPVAEPAAAPEPAPEPEPAPAPSGSVEEAIATWFPELDEKAARVANCESGMNPGAVSAGGGNHGLFQINDVHRDSFTSVTGQGWGAVYDAYYNAQFARYLYNQSGWQPWACRGA